MAIPRDPTPPTVENRRRTDSKGIAVPALRFFLKFVALGLVPILGIHHYLQNQGIPDPTAGLAGVVITVGVWALWWWLSDVGFFPLLWRLTGLRLLWKWLRRDEYILVLREQVRQWEHASRDLGHEVVDECRRRVSTEKELAELQRDYGTLKLAHRSLKDAHHDTQAQLDKMARQVASAKGQVTRLRKAAGLPTGKKPSRKKPRRAA